MTDLTRLTRWGLSGWLATQLTATWVLAQPSDAAPPVRVVRAESASSCPDQDQFLQDLAARLEPGAPVASSSPIRVEFGREPANGNTATTGSAQRWVALVTTGGEASDAHGQRLESTTPDCTELYQAALTLVSVQLSQPPPPAPTENLTDDANATPPRPAPPVAAVSTAAARPTTPTSEASPARQDHRQRRWRGRRGSGATRETSGRSRRVWAALEIAQDLALAEATQNPCTDRRYECLEGDHVRDQLGEDGHAEKSYSLESHLTRVFLTLGWPASEHWTVRSRLGMAWGLPKRNPPHSELAAVYWFGHGDSRIRATLAMALGYARHDAYTFSMLTDEATIDIYRVYGPLFAKLAPGALLRLHRVGGIRAELGLVVTSPPVGAIVQPTVGYARHF